MSWFDLRLIPLFSLYLALAFCLSTGTRVHQYWTVISLVRKFPARWPRLLTLLRDYSHIFLTWKILFPLIIMLALLTLNLLAGRLIWPQAQQFTARDLLSMWPLTLLVVVCALVMLAYDAYGIWNVSPLDGKELESYFDRAESWLPTWKGSMVRWATLGWINPRQMVAKEVQTALEGVSDLLTSTLWWVSLQTGLRIACGLSLWGSYVVHTNMSV